MISTAYRMFENIIANSSDKDLNEAKEVLDNLKEKYRISYKGFLHIPFIRDLFDILEGEYNYRNQVDSE